VENELIINQSLLENMKTCEKRFEDVNVSLCSIQVLKNNDMIKVLDALEEETSRDIKQQSQLKSSDFK
jgi:hypothetical protein